MVYDGAEKLIFTFFDIGDIIICGAWLRFNFLM